MSGYLVISVVEGGGFKRINMDYETYCLLYIISDTGVFINIISRYLRSPQAPFKITTFDISTTYVNIGKLGSTEHVSFRQDRYLRISTLPTRDLSLLVFSIY